MRDFSGDHRWLSINTFTLDRQGDLAAIIDACARRAVPAVAVWRHQVNAVGAARAAAMLRDAGLASSSYCRGGMLVADRTHRQAARDDNLLALEEARTLAAPCLVVVPGGLPQYSRPGSAPSKDIAEARKMIVDELGYLLPHARAAGVPLALEPMHPMLAADRGCVSTLRQALDMCDGVDPGRHGGIGVAFDAYHCWWDPELRDQIERAGAARILVYQVSDWLVPTTHLVNDRGMMGDGIIDLRTIRGWVEAAGYGGYAEVEIFSERWWSRPMDDVIEMCVQRHRSSV